MSYRIQLDDNADFSSPIVDDSNTSSNYTPSNPLADGTYYWRVRATDDCVNVGDWSSEWDFNIDTEAPSTPVLASPPNGETTGDNTPELDWSDVSGVVAYQLQVNNYPDFTDPGIDTTVENSTFTPSTPLVNDTYYWRVRSKDGTGNWGSWSSVWNFTIDTQGPSVDVIFPTSHETFSVGETITIRWDANDSGYYLSPGGKASRRSGRSPDSGRPDRTKRISVDSGARGFNLSGNGGNAVMDSVETIGIYISRDSGENWDVLFTDLENDGDENWEVTGPESDSCLIKVVAYDGCGNEGEALSGQFGIGSATGVGDNTNQGTPMPRAFALLQNYPNPFNPHTVIGYDVPETGKATRVGIFIYDTRGRMVRVLVDEVKSSGNHQVFWNGENDRGEELSSGIYFYVMRAGEFVNTRKMIMLR